MQKKPSSQEFADRELWRYPVQIAELLLGTSEPQRIIDSVTEFAKTDYDTIDEIEYVPGIVKTVWAGYGGRDPGRFRRSFTEHLGDLAAESVVASAYWYRAHGCIPAQAVFLWTSYLCCCTRLDDGGLLDPSVSGLSDWVLHGVSPPEALTVAGRMCESLFAFVNWNDAIEVLWLLACIRAAVGDENPVVEPLDAKFAMQGDYFSSAFTFNDLLYVWLDIDSGQLLPDRAYCKCRYIGHPGEDTENLRRKHSEASTLFQNMLSGCVGKYIGVPQE